VFDNQFVEMETSGPSTTNRDPDRPIADQDLRKQISESTERLRFSNIVKKLNGF
jgi:hypothetical protein